MKCSRKDIVGRLKKKAMQSQCRYKVAAIGLDHRGRVIGVEHNRQRFPRKGGGLHAELRLMQRCPKSLKTILIVRLGNGGVVRPIAPCNACQTKADELGITIRTVEE